MLKSSGSMAIVSLFLSLSLFPSAFPSAFAAETADQIVRKADDARGPKIPYSFTARVTNYNGSEVQDNTYRVSSKGTDLSLVAQTEPTRLQGRKLLMKGRDLWLYTPEIKRPTRIGFEQRLTGEVSNGDLARTHFAADYNSVLKGQEKVGGPSGKMCYKLHLTAKTKEVTYREIDYWVEKTTYYPLKAQFFAISGKLLKSAIYSDFKPILGHNRLTKTIIQDALQPSKRSVLIYTKQKKENFDDSFFSKESLGE